MRRAMVIAATCAAAFGIQAALATTGTGWGSAPAHGPAAAPAETVTRAVTLVTGDRAMVRLRGDRVASVEVDPAPGRERVPYFQLVEGGRVIVAPVDALAAANAGELDRRRLDVAALARAGFADARTAVLPPPSPPTPPTNYQNVTISVIDHNGRPADARHAWVACAPADRDTPVASCGDATVNNGVAVAPVLPGVYNFVVGFTAASSPRASFVFLPEVAVRAPMSLTADARDTASASIAVPRADAYPTDAAVGYCYSQRTDDSGPCGMLFAVHAPSLADISFNTTGPLNPPGGFSLRAQAHLAAPTTDTVRCDSYHVAVSVADRIPPSPSWRVADADLATVRTTFHAQRPGVAANLVEAANPAGNWILWPLVREHIQRLPAGRVECYQGGQDWYRRLAPGPDWNDYHVDSADQVAFTAGRTYTDQWDAAVRAPGLTPRTVWGDRPTTDSVVRTTPIFPGPDTIGVRLGMRSDPQQRQVPYFPAGESLNVELYRDGVLVQPTAGAWEIDRSAAWYTISARSITNDPDRPLSDDVQLDWTFWSEHASGTRPLPVTALTYAPRVDADNTASSCAAVPIRITAYRQPGSPPPRVVRWTLRVSFDNGSTWRQVDVAGGAEDAQALIPRPPAGAKAVALDTRVVDQDGGVTRERITHAFLLR